MIYCTGSAFDLYGFSGTKLITTTTILNTLFYDGQAEVTMVAEATGAGAGLDPGWFTAINPWPRVITIINH